MSSASIHFGTSRRVDLRHPRRRPQRRPGCTPTNPARRHGRARRSRASRAAGRRATIGPPTRRRSVRRAAPARTASPTRGPIAPSITIVPHPPRGTPLVVGDVAGGQRAVVVAQVGDVRAEHDPVRCRAGPEGERGEESASPRVSRHILRQRVFLAPNHPLDVAGVAAQRSTRTDRPPPRTPSRRAVDRAARRARATTATDANRGPPCRSPSSPPTTRRPPASAMIGYSTSEHAGAGGDALAAAEPAGRPGTCGRRSPPRRST